VKDKGSLLTVAVPMYNEAGYILATVEAVREICRELVLDAEISDYELLIIDDASTDGTGLMADRLAAGDPRIRVIHHEFNRKLGGSLKTAFANARGELILYTDADLPCDMAELKRACRLLRTYPADIVSAYRMGRRSEGMRRVIYSRAYNLIIRSLFGLRIRDVNFAFKLFRRSVFEEVKPVCEGSFIDAEILIWAERLGFKIIQFSVDYFPRTQGVSRLSSAGVIWTILVEMMKRRKALVSVRPHPAAIRPVPATLRSAATQSGTPSLDVLHVSSKGKRYPRR